MARARVAKRERKKGAFSECRGKLEAEKKPSKPPLVQFNGGKEEKEEEEEVGREGKIAVSATATKKKTVSIFSCHIREKKLASTSIMAHMSESTKDLEKEEEVVVVVKEKQLTRIPSPNNSADEFISGESTVLK